MTKLKDYITNIVTFIAAALIVVIIIGIFLIVAGLAWRGVLAVWNITL